MPKKTGNSTYLKEYNRSMLMTLIREHEHISYTELSKLSGLAPKSVYEIASGLIEEGYIEEAFTGKSSGGRKPAMLSLKPGSYYSIGIDIDVGRIKAVLMDYIGTVKYQAEKKMDIKDYDVHVIQIADIVNEVLEKTRIIPARVMGIGISVAGLINLKTQKIVMAPNLEWENKNLINDLKNRLEYSIYLENEAMTSAVCEKWIGDCRNDRDFICINIMSGIGAGIYINDKPFRGVSGSAGEIGHITMDRNGPVCGCNNRGCLETFSSTASILKKGKEIYGESLSIDELIRYAKEGDQRAIEIFDTAADYLGMAVCYLVNTFNPSKIVFGKDFTKYSEFMINTLAERVKSTALKNNYDSVELVISKFGEQASVLGAAILPVRKVFNI